MPKSLHTFFVTHVDIADNDPSENFLPLNGKYLLLRFKIDTTMCPWVS